MYGWMYVCMDVCMYVCMDGCMDVCMDGCMHGWMYVCMDVLRVESTDVAVRALGFVYTSIHTYIHTYIQGDGRCSLTISWSNEY